MMKLTATVIASAVALWAGGACAQNVQSDPSEDQPLIIIIPDQGSGAPEAAIPDDQRDDQTGLGQDSEDDSAATAELPRGQDPALSNSDADAMGQQDQDQSMSNGDQGSMQQEQGASSPR
jgi:hypothetical protein